MDESSVAALLGAGGDLNRLRSQTLILQDLIALPSDVRIHDLETFRDGRRRFRGRFTTSSVPDFVAYVKDNATSTEGGKVKPTGFIEPKSPEASVFFNLYNDDTGAGHADWKAYLELEQTAAYRSLLAINGTPLTQRKLTDWLEDWQNLVAPYGAEGEVISLAKAVGAIGKLEIKSGKQTSHAQDDFRAARSALEEVEAQIGDTMPRIIGFECDPYHGLRARTFRLRVSILTNHEAPQLVLRIMQKEATDEDIILEFKKLLQSELGDTADLVIGSFKP